MKLPVVSCEQMRGIEQAAFAGGATPEALMERVALAIAAEALEGAHGPGHAAVYYGKGHNGGDALAAARLLRERGWEIEPRPLEPDPARLAPLTARQLERLEATPRGLADPLPRGTRPVILDGLLGLGATGPLRDDVRALTREINTRRAAGDARVLAIDLPTGMDGDSGAADEDCVVADCTIAAGYAKRGLVADCAPDFVGRLHVAPLPELEAYSLVAFEMETATPESLRGLLPRRRYESHKTQFGRIGIVAGSPGLLGAAVLCASGALHAGGGMITIFAPEDIHGMLAMKAPPEVMVRLVQRYPDVLEMEHDVLAVGPGLGVSRPREILRLIEEAQAPMVLDADGLNIMAERDIALLGRCAGPRLLTPHPGEMGRLYRESKSLPRQEAVTRFASRFARTRKPLTLLLKGSRTVIHEAGRPTSYNTTGHPGMATGGMGDVLTGVCAALIGQHLEGFDAARVGAWVCGRAAELCALEMAEEAVTPMCLVAKLGAALAELRATS